MKNKLFAIIFPFIMAFANYGNNGSIGYIRIKYFGEVSKPFPIITFYLPSSIDTTYEIFFIYNIELTEIEFDSVRKSIEGTRNDIILDILPDLVEITIVKNGEKKYVLTRDKGTIKELFNNIIIQFKGTCKEKLVKESLNELLESLGIAKIDEVDSQFRGRRRQKLD